MDDYEELEHLGRGAFGEVLLMKQKSTGLLCAVKRLTKQSLTAAEEAEHLSEVKALQALQHPCILKYYGSLEGKESLSLVMEYADAGDLQQLLRRQADTQALFEAVTLFAIFAQLVVAVAHAHKHRVLHRDLKPSNVMLTSSGVLKLGDFGVAKVLAGTTACDQMTCVGSPTYMAPEIVSGEPYGSPCDVWSLGVILYELSSFRKPFEGRSLGEIVMRISSGKFAALGTHLADRPGGRSIEDAVNPLIARMLVSEAKRRAKMPEVLCTPALQLFVQSLRSSAVVVASAIKSSKEPEASEGAMLDAAVADALLLASGTSPSSPSSAPTAAASQDRSLPPPAPGGGGGKGEVRSSLASKASKKEVEEDSLAFSLTSDGDDSSASSRMASLLRKRPDGEVSFNLTATDATNVLQLSATKRVRGEAPGGAASSSSKTALQKTAGHGRSQDAAALRSVLGDVLEEESGGGFPEGEEDATWDPSAPPVAPSSSSSFPSDDTVVQSHRAAATASSSLSGTRAMEAAVLQDAMGGSRTLDGADARSRKHVLQEFGGTQDVDGFVNPSWKISTRTQGHSSGFSSGSSSPSNAGSPPWSSEGGSGGERPPLGRPAARPTPGYKAEDKPLPSHAGRSSPGGVHGAPSLRSAGDRAVRGNQPQQVKIQARNQASAYEVVQRKSSRGSSRSSQSQDNDRSVTWPQIEVHVPDMRHKLPRGAGGVAQQQQQPRVHLRSTTPPAAGRPSTPESARQARIEKERLRSMQRNGALTIPFFDKPAAPPQGFLERMNQHQHQQEEAASEDIARSGAAARKMLPATRSQPAIHGAKGAGASPSPGRNVGTQDGRRQSSLGR